MKSKDLKVDLAYGFHLLAAVIAVVFALLVMVFDRYSEGLGDKSGAAGGFGFLVALPLGLGFLGAAGLGVLLTFLNLGRWPLLVLTLIVSTACFVFIATDGEGPPYFFLT